MNISYTNIPCPGATKTYSLQIVEAKMYMQMNGVGNHLVNDTAISSVKGKFWQTDNSYDITLYAVQETSCPFMKLFLRN